MKLAAIYNVWHDWDILEHSIGNISPLVDKVIIIGSNYSNYGELSIIPDEWRFHVNRVFEPNPRISPMINETEKRNLGLQTARVLGCTHFITMDADEFYDPAMFLQEKLRFKNHKLNGLVCGSNVYFKSPTLTIGLATTLVPFIHKLSPNINHCINRGYPFAFNNREIRIDPTRQLGYTTGIEWSNIVMDHMSWVRKDIEIKIRNSTAKSNIERSTIRKDFEVAKAGEYCNFYRKYLFRVANKYNIPELNGVDVSNIQQGVKPVSSTDTERAAN